MDDYALLDVGDGARLERFGSRVTDRPHGGSLGPRRDAARWRTADLRFDRELGWSADDPAALEPWSVSVAGLVMGLRPTETGQVGLYPEHAGSIEWLVDQVRSRLATVPAGAAPAVLNLFASTGLGTLAMGRAGAAVAHVDASRPAVTWARDNAARNDLADRPIRWLVEDAARFVAREDRRGRRYDGVVLDPPSYGHGEGGRRAWRIEDDLAPLLAGCRRLLAEDGFILLTAHTEAFGPDRLGDALATAWGGTGADRIEVDELGLDSQAGGRLELGAVARWDRRS